MPQLLRTSPVLFLKPTQKQNYFHASFYSSRVRPPPIKPPK